MQQDYEDMSNDANTIRNEQRDINQDKREERHDLKNGNFGAAAGEQARYRPRACETRTRPRKT